MCCVCIVTGKFATYSLRVETIYEIVYLSNFWKNYGALIHEKYGGNPKDDALFIQALQGIEQQVQKISTDVV